MDLGASYHLHAVRFSVAQLHEKYRHLGIVDHSKACWLFLLAEPTQQPLDASAPVIVAKAQVATNGTLAVCPLVLGVCVPLLISWELPHQFEIDFSKGTEQPGSIRHPLLNCQEFEYSAPRNLGVRAVRIQLEGVGALALRSVEVFQGSTERAHSMQQRRQSFVKSDKMARALTTRRRAATSHAQRRPATTQACSVHRLIDGAHSAYASIAEWVARCKGAARYFDKHQLQLLRDVVFLPCADEQTSDAFEMAQDLLSHSGMLLLLLLLRRLPLSD